MKKLNSSHKYPYAYDICENMILLEDAIKAKDTRYFLDPKLQIELKLYRKKTRNETHWRALPNQKLIIDSIEYEYSIDKDSESFEHKMFKYKIIQDKFIFIKEYKLYLIDPKEELRIIDSQFRADVLAHLECGTLCVIEIIKTSDLSKQKKDFLEEQEILTCKIYIDEKGNQIYERDDIIGVSKIREIKKSTEKAERILQHLCEWIEIKKRNGNEQQNKEITEIDKELSWFSFRFGEVRDKIEQVDEQLRIYEKPIREKYDRRIRDLTRKYKEMQCEIQSESLYKKIGERYKTVLNE